MYRLIEKLHLERYLNSRLILAIDLVVSGVASLCALVLVRLLLPPLSNISKFALLWIGCAVVYSFITFFLLKTYRSVIRHSTWVKMWVPVPAKAGSPARPQAASASWAGASSLGYSHSPASSPLAGRRRRATFPW